MYFVAEQHHGIRFADALRVPEDTQLAADIAPYLHRVDHPVHPQILLALSHDFDQLLTTVVE